MKSFAVLATFFFSNFFLFSQSSDSLTIVSWNVFLRPGILKDRQLERVDSIAKSLLEMNADVIALQEVFHKKSRKRLISALSKTYPYHTSTGKKSFWGVPSGNCIFSKDSIQSEQFIYYKRAMNADKLAKKGAIAVDINHLGKSFTVYGTHLQAGGGIDGARIRASQIDQLAAMSEKKDHTTAIFAGDFNVKYKDTLYEYIAKRLNIINFDPSNLELGTANFSDHALTSSSGKPKWIDFIFLRTSNEIRFRRSFLKEPRCLFGQKLDRISDHNPIITVFEW